MARLGIVICALFLSGCNSLLPNASAPQASAPPTPQAEGEGPAAVGVVVAPPLADIDCAPHRGEITCN